MDMLVVLPVLLLSCTTAAAPTCGRGANIGSSEGVQIEAVNGSQVELGPLTNSNIIKSGSTITISFRPQSTWGLIFAALDERSNDMVAAYLHDGHLAFARRCQKFHYVGIGKKLEMGRWYTVEYHHLPRGGTMHVDGSNHYREYPMWGCQDLSKIYFGGVPNQLQRKVYWKKPHQHFHGCIKNAMLDGTFPDVALRYHIVSSCQYGNRNNMQTNRP